MAGYRDQALHVRAGREKGESHKDRKKNSFGSEKKNGQRGLKCQDDTAEKTGKGSEAVS